MRGGEKSVWKVCCERCAEENLDGQEEGDGNGCEEERYDNMLYKGLH